MTRIIAGEFRGRRIKVPESGTRPTADRVREAIFSSLSSLDAIEDLNVLDLYSGSGALGIEAISRGAKNALFVDSNKSACQTITSNLKELEIEANVSEVKVETLLKTPPAHKFNAPFHLIFLDPPYDYSMDDISTVLDLGLKNSWFSSDAILVVETSKALKEFVWPEGFESLRDKSYGDTTVWYGQVCKK